VLKWVRTEASARLEPKVGSSVVTVEVDEMWHYFKKSLPSCGSGAPMTWISGALWPECWVGMMMQPAAACSTRSA